jgi:two-component system NarL family response regulator
MKTERNTGRKIRILVVDDHTLVREGFVRLLQMVPDFEVVGQAARAEEAINCLEKAETDIILMDIRLPGISGIELTRTIREKFGNVEIIILSMYDEEEYVLEAIQGGASGYVLKDISPEELIRTIRVVHSGGSLINPSLARKVLKNLSGETRKPAASDKDRENLELSDRELQVLQLVANGNSNKEVAEILVISDKTVKAHLRNIFRKLNVNDRAEAVARAMRKGLVE